MAVFAPIGRINPHWYSEEIVIDESITGARRTLFEQHFIAQVTAQLFRDGAGTVLINPVHYQVAFDNTRALERLGFSLETFHMCYVTKK
jgi:hypothetical protein